MALLDMKGICKAFFGAWANDHVDLAVEQGEIHALLGENGAGKTTLMNILFGLYTADAGEVLWKGKPVCFASPQQALAAGIGMVHQHFTLVPTMTVQQNITLGLRTEGYPFVKTQAVSRDIRELSEKYGLAVDPAKRVQDLSVGEQQRVEIIKVLYRKAQLLILDEPTAVLTPGETEEFFAILQRLKGEGHAIILITHRMSEIVEVSDRVTILRGGKNVVRLVTAETNAAELAAHMMGQAPLTVDEDKGHKSKPGSVQLLLNGITLREEKTEKLANLELAVHKGEILGIAGVDGNGQKELAEVLVGIRRPSEGNITYREEDITTLGVAQRFEKGIAYVSDDRHHDGLVLDMDLADNMALRLLRQKAYCKHGVLRRGALRAFAQSAMEEYSIKTAGVGHPVRLMSGGNQQKAVLARELGAAPSLIVVSQPTRGLDIGATHQMRNILREVRNGGGSVVLISADLEEVLELSDRIAVLFRGRLMGIVENGPQISRGAIGSMMGGRPLEVRGEGTI